MGIIQEYLSQYEDKLILYFCNGGNAMEEYESIGKYIGGGIYKINIEFKSDEDPCFQILQLIDKHLVYIENCVLIISENCFNPDKGVLINSQKNKYLFYQYRDLFLELRKKRISNLLAITRDVITILNSQDEIESAYNILFDWKSQKVFRNFLFSKFSFDINLINEIFEPNQYFVKDIFSFKDNEIFVDAGAHQGDTLFDFITEVNNKFEKIYLFEPESSNFLKLQSYVDTLQFGDKIVLFRNALYDTKAILKMIPDGNCSELNDLGEQIVLGIDMDGILSNERITFIKMDIEGAEIPALKGAVKLIKKNSPKLAICTYHNTDDIWLIPLLIHSINSCYRIYLRHHDISTPSETVCYAV